MLGWTVQSHTECAGTKCAIPALRCETPCQSLLCIFRSAITEQVHDVGCEGEQYFTQTWGGGGGISMCLPVSFGVVFWLFLTLILSGVMWDGCADNSVIMLSP